MARRPRRLEASSPRGGRTTRPSIRGARESGRPCGSRPIAATHLDRPRNTPDLAAGTLSIEAPIANPVAGTTLEIIASDADGEVARATVDASLSFSPIATLTIPIGRRRAWSPEDPHLYSLCFLVRVDDTLVDRVDSYAGLRSVSVDGHRVLLNGKPVFQRLVLDQGWYPDGLMTAPSDDALIADIELAQQAGFNGARLHQKVFEERFLYHADRLGYLVWGEFADWGARRRRAAAVRELHHAVDRGGQSRLLASVDRRLVPAQRDLRAARRRHLRAR